MQPEDVFFLVMQVLPFTLILCNRRTNRDNILNLQIYFFYIPIPKGPESKTNGESSTLGLVAVGAERGCRKSRDEWKWRK